IIIIASPLPQGNPPTAVPQATAASQSQPTAASQAQPTQAVSGPAPTVPAGSASKGTVTFAFDAFATYYPGIIIDVKKLLQARGYELKLVPFGLDTAAPSEEERWAKLKSGEWDVLATTLDGFARQSDPSMGAILDVLISSRPALTNKAEAIQAFHDAWFEALKLMVDTPDQAEQAIIDWGHTDWTFIAKPGDLKASLEHLAQATLNSNQIAFQ